MDAADIGTLPKPKRSTGVTTQTVITNYAPNSFHGASDAKVSGLVFDLEPGLEFEEILCESKRWKSIE